MKKFIELDISIQNELIEVSKSDEYQLNPEFLYINIYNSRGTTKLLAKIFEVEEELIRKIKNQNKTDE